LCGRQRRDGKRAEACNARCEREMDCGTVPRMSPAKKASKKPADRKAGANAESQLAGFLAKYSPEIEALAKAARTKLRSKLPGAIELVYDNYNALAIGYAPSERASEAIFSIALYPRWVSLFFLQAKGLRDPNGLLRGSGRVVRHIVLQRPDDLDLPAVRDLMEQALESAKVGLDPKAPRRLVIKSVSAKQRPRWPKS